jgi:superfamily II DNA or RNA helicase
MFHLDFYDNNYVEMKSDDTWLVEQVKKRFTFNKLSYKDRKRVKYKICLIKNNMFLPIGLLDDCIKLLKSLKYEYTISSKLHRKRYEFDEITNLRDEIEKFNIRKEKKLRYYQYLAVKESFTKKNIVLESPTASGKSLIMYVLCRLFLNMLKNSKSSKKILIIVPRINLVEQLFNDFVGYSDYNITKHIKMIYSEYDKIITENQNIIISTWQSLQNFQNKDFFKNVKYLMVDESHGAAQDDDKRNKAIVDIIMSCLKTEYRIALTGTVPESSEEKLLYYNLKGLFGDVFVVSTLNRLIKEKFISDIAIKMVVFDYGKLEKYRYDSYNSYQNELDYLKTKNDKYNMTVDICKSSNKNILILLKSIESGRNLKRKFEKIFKNRKIWIINSKDTKKAKDRIQCQNICEDSDNNIIIATFGTFAEGVNIRNLHIITFYENLKSRQKTLQSIGRGLRLHKHKKKLKLYDLCEKIQYKKYGNWVIGSVYKHYRCRKKYYNQNSLNYKVFVIDKSEGKNVK